MTFPTTPGRFFKTSSFLNRTTFSPNSPPPAEGPPNTTRKSLNAHSKFISSYLGEVPKAEGAGILFLLQIMDIPIHFKNQRGLVTIKIGPPLFPPLLQSELKLILKFLFQK